MTQPISSITTFGHFDSYKQSSTNDSPEVDLRTSRDFAEYLKQSTSKEEWVGKTIHKMISDFLQQTIPDWITEIMEIFDQIDPENRTKIVEALQKWMKDFRFKDIKIRRALQSIVAALAKEKSQGLEKKEMRSEVASDLEQIFQLQNLIETIEKIALETKEEDSHETLVPCLEVLCSMWEGVALVNGIETNKVIDWLFSKQELEKKGMRSEVVSYLQQIFQPQNLVEPIEKIILEIKDNAYQHDFQSLVSCLEILRSMREEMDLVDGIHANKVADWLSSIQPFCNHKYVGVSKLANIACETLRSMGSRDRKVRVSVLTSLVDSLPFSSDFFTGAFVRWMPMEWTLRKARQMMAQFQKETLEFVNPVGAVEPMTDVMNFLINPKKKILLIQGEAASGKTLFTKKIALKLLDDFIQDQTLRFPIYVPLDQIEKPLGEVIKEGYEFAKISSVLQGKLSRLPKVWILDAYDKIRFKIDMDGKLELKNLYNANNLHKEDRAKYIFTCRTGFCEDGYLTNKDFESAQFITLPPR